MNDLFAFSPTQLRVTAALAGLAAVMGIYLLVHQYAVGDPQQPSLQVYFGAEPAPVSGLFVLDPNTAPADSLELLPGIGRVLADRIVAYRMTRRFDDPLDVTNVEGIGPKTYERIKPYLRVIRP